MAGERMVQAEDGTFVPESYYAGSSREERVIAAMAKRLVAMEQKLENLTAGNRSPQLAYSTVHDGSVLYRDTDGNIRRVEGRQPDGTVTGVDVNAPPPPAPSPPIVEALAGGFTVRWDGLFTGGQSRPSDWRRVDVHINLTAGFAPTVATVDGGIFTATGGTLHFTTDSRVPHYVRLVAVNTSGTSSLSSAEVTVTPQDGEVVPGSVGSIHLANGAVQPQHLTAEMVLASKIVAGNPAGARVVLDGVSNEFAAYDSGGLQTFLIDGDTGDVVATGEFQTDVSGERIAINSSATPAKTIRFYPPTGTAHAAIYRTGTQLVMKSQSGANGKSGNLFADETSAVISTGVMSGSQDSYVTTVPTAVQIRGGSSFVWQILAGFENWPAFINNQNNCGILAGRRGTDASVIVVYADGATHADITCRATHLTSGRDTKRLIEDIPIDAVAAVRAAPSKMWERPDPPLRPPGPKSDFGPGGPDGVAPLNLGSNEPSEVLPPMSSRGVKHFGPIAEDLPSEIVSRDEMTGSLVVDVGSQIGILWKAVEQIAERLDVLERRGPVTRADTVSDQP